MGIFNSCLLVSDFDGTLYTEGAVPQRNVDAIEYFMNNGGVFSVATGRGPSVAKKVIKLIKTNAPLILVNGAVIFDPQKGKIIEIDLLREDAKQITAEVIEKFPEIGAEIIMADRNVTINENSDTIRHRKGEGLEDIIKTFDEIKDEDWIKTLLMSGNPNVFNGVKQYLDSQNAKDYELVSTNPIFYEILPKGTDKSIGVAKLKKLTKCEKVFCIGDFYNDLQMVKIADIGAFVSNAPEELKKQAGYVCGDVKTGAVADFIHYIEKYLSKQN